MRKLKVGSDPTGSLTFSWSHNILLWTFVLSAVLSQWLYLLQQRTQVFPRLFASSFLWTLLLIVSTSFSGGTLGFRISESAESKRLSRAVLIFALSTIPSILISLIAFGNYSYALDGLKVVSTLLAVVSVVNALRNRVSLAFKLVLAMYAILLLFGGAQLVIGLNYATAEGFFTIGATRRWWDYSAVWGPMATTGKNTYGVALLLCLCIIVPLYYRNSLNRKIKILVGLSIPLALLCIYSSKSRIATILVGLLLMSEFLLRCKRRRNFAPAVFGLFSISVAILMLSVFMDTPPTQKWLTSTQSIVARFDSREAAISSDLNNWLWGVGYNGIFKVTASTFGSSLATANRELGVNVDNFYIRRTIETGILGLFPFLYLLYCLVFSAGPTIKPTVDALPKVDWIIPSRYLGMGIGMSCTTGDYLSFLNIVGIFAVCVACICVGKNKAVEFV